MSEEIVYQRFVTRYETGELPWDDRLPPPEVIDLVAGMQAGWALDLGCGYGRSAIYLAQKGWQVDGIDYVAQAIVEAKIRARQAGVGERTHFHVGSVTALDFLQRPYQLAIDVGCLHNLTFEQATAYRDGLLRLLASDGVYLLFARLREDEEVAADEIKRVSERELYSLFADDFRLTHRAYGTTVTPDQSWRSVWLWYRKG